MTVKYLSLMTDGQRSVFHFAAHLKLGNVLTVITYAVFIGQLLYSVCSANAHHCVRGEQWNEAYLRATLGKSGWRSQQETLFPFLSALADEQSTTPHFHYHLIFNKPRQ